MLDFLALASGGSAPSGVDTADFHFTAWGRSEPLRPIDSTVGDADLDGGIEITRIRWDRTTLTLNRTGAGQWRDWAVGRGGWSVILSWASTVVTLLVSERSGAGGGFIKWNPSAADVTKLDTISAGVEIRIQVQP